MGSWHYSPAVLLAAISWLIIEKPALRLKRHPLFTVSARTLSDSPVEILRPHEVMRGMTME